MINRIIKKALFFLDKRDFFLHQLLGFKTNNEKLYIKALQHKSYSSNNNERLEFLGDAVLNQIVSEHLYFVNENQEEGSLSKQRAIIVSRKHLNRIGKKLIKPANIKSCLKKIPDKIFGDTLEAIIGAICIDKGIEVAKVFVTNKIIHSEFIKEFQGGDYKSKLQELAHKRKQKIKYKILEEKGLDHNKEFIVAVFLEDISIAKAKACSVKEAEQEAAKKALKIVS